MEDKLIERIHGLELGVSEIRTEMKGLNRTLQLYSHLDGRVRELENFKNKAVGYSAAVGGITALLVSLVAKLM